MKLVPAALVNVFLVIVLVSSMSLVGITSSIGEYDPWTDLDDDGKIGITDLYKVAAIFGTTGDPINKTALLLELEARMDALNGTIVSLKECIVVIGSIPYDENGAYDTIIGLSQDVSGLIPTEFTLVAAVATGYKAHAITGARQDEPPLTLEPKVSGMVFQTRVWDASGNEYGGSNWSTMTAHIDYTLFMTT